jgi:hypothetical protein
MTQPSSGQTDQDGRDRPGAPWPGDDGNVAVAIAGPPGAVFGRRKPAMPPGSFSQPSAVSQLARSQQVHDQDWLRPGTEEAVACECS